MVGGEGIKEGTAGEPVTFQLDGRNAGPGQLGCRCRAPSGKMTYVLISDNKVCPDPYFPYNPVLVKIRVLPASGVDNFFLYIIQLWF